MWPRQYRRKRLGPGLPAQTGISAELAIPHPHPVSRQTRNSAAVRKHKGPTGSLSINQAGQKGVGIRGNPRELLLGRFLAQVVGRPAALEGGHVFSQVVARGPDKAHGGQRIDVRF